MIWLIIVLFKESIELIIFMLTGFLLVKCHSLREDQTGGLSNVLTKAALPATILMSCQIPFSWRIVSIIGQSAIVSLLFMILTLVVSLLVPHIFHVQGSLKSIWIGCCTFSNILFIGIPIIGAIYGKTGLITLVTYNAFSNLFLFTFGLKLYSGQTQFEWRKLLFTPAIFASFLGFMLFFAKISLVGPVGQALTSLGNMTAPLSMLITGALFAGTDIKKVFRRLDIYQFCFTRLVLLPIILVPLLKLGIQNKVILGVMVIAAAMPAGAINTAMAELYAGQGERASEYVVSSTVFSMLTIPLVAYLSLFV
ncbi:AEC family transporter [Oenococcus sicerae]|uniref:AEC family transporter n=1 Tax=Oenococcus sicerae TaxID=2203724 RepID=UPI0039ED1CB5